MIDDSRSIRERARDARFARTLEPDETPMIGGNLRQRQTECGTRIIALVDERVQVLLTDM